MRISPQLVENKERDGYAPAAIAAYVALLCAGAQQNPAGRFKNLDVLKGHLGQHRRWIRWLIEQNDITKLADGTYYVVGWDEWQEGDWQAAERMQRVRNDKKRRNERDAISDGADRNERDATVLLSSSYLSSSSEEQAPNGTNGYGPELSKKQRAAIAAKAAALAKKLSMGRPPQPVYEQQFQERDPDDIDPDDQRTPDPDDQPVPARAT